MENNPSVFPAIACPINIVFVCLFGVKRYGVHINGYCQDENGELRMWVGRRSMTKQTYPGKLDNLVSTY